MKFDFDWPTEFSDILKLWTMDADDDGQMQPVYTISSPMSLKGSGELKREGLKSQSSHYLVLYDRFYLLEFYFLCESY